MLLTPEGGKTMGMDVLPVNGEKDTKTLVSSLLGPNLGVSLT